MKTIYTRRSIRKYTEDPVPEENIKKIIRAGMNAPSAGNEQPWYFVIITDGKKLNAIADFHPFAQMARQATVAILVCGDPGLEKHKGMWIQDCSAATQNMLLEITDMGLGGVWVGIFPREKRMDGFRELLNIPSDIIPFSLIPVGFPAEMKEPNDKFLPDRIRMNSW
jgi:nitroreductase